MDSDFEFSESGNPVYRHKPRERDWEPAEYAGRNLEAIEAHVEKYIGKIETVFHELVSDLVHLDVLFVPATSRIPHHTLITSGASDLPMKTPQEMDDFNRVELLVALPREWPLTQEALQRENNYWPVRWLKQIGRLPHEYDTWIGWGHTIPNGDPPAPIANTQFTGFMLAPPYWLGPDFFQLRAPSGDTISFYHLVPLYPEEMDFKLKHGAEALENKFDEKQIGFVLDVGRANVAKNRRWWGIRDK